MYESLAKIYDEFMDDVDYDLWAKELDDIIKKHDKGKKVLELACGSGNITLRLAKMGYDIVGGDISSEMLNLAREKTSKAGVRTRFIKADMANINIGKTFDVVCANCDGVNYLREIKDVKGFIDSAYSSLVVGGLLIFDVSHPDKLTHILGDNTFHDLREDMAFIWQNRLEPPFLHMDLTVFLKEGNMYNRFEEEQTQRIYNKDEILPLLEGYNILSEREVHYDYKKQDRRIQFVCVKK